jgi:glycopeptide antibiotics resistance protein
MRTAPPRGRGRILAAVSASVYLVVLAAVLFWPQHIDSQAGPLYDVLLRVVPAAFPFGIDPTLNVVMMVPFGVILATVLPRQPLVILGVAWVVPLMAEIAQGLFLPGRTSSAVDVAANTLGGILGAAGLATLRRLTRRRRPE